MRTAAPMTDTRMRGKPGTASNGYASLSTDFALPDEPFHPSTDL
jgi:hypothetical protein